MIYFVHKARYVYDDDIFVMFPWMRNLDLLMTESVEVFDMIYSEGFVSIIVLVTSKSQNAQGWLCWLLVDNALCLRMLPIMLAHVANLDKDTHIGNFDTWLQV